jgi:hypothetical protein
MKSTISAGKAFRISGIPVLIASLCCLAPVILVALGLSSAAFAASLTDYLDGRYRWLFILAGLLLLAVSIRSYLNKQNICTLDQARKRRNEVINIAALALIAAVASYLVFFYIIVGYLGRLLKIWH